MPAVDVRLARLDDVPRLANKHRQVLLAFGARDLHQLAVDVDDLAVEVEDVLCQFITLRSAVDGVRMDRQSLLIIWKVNS